MKRNLIKTLPLEGVGPARRRQDGVRDEDGRLHLHAPGRPVPIRVHQGKVRVKTSSSQVPSSHYTSHVLQSLRVQGQEVLRGHRLHYQQGRLQGEGESVHGRQGLL